MDIFFKNTAIFSESTTLPSLKITGNFSGMASGLNLHFTNSYVIGAGGNSTATGGINGGDAIYIDATGTLNIYKDKTSVFGGGGGCSPAITSGDIFNATGPRLNSTILLKINQIASGNKPQKEFFLKEFEKSYSEAGDSSVSGPFGFKVLKKYYFDHLNNVKAGAGAGSKPGVGSVYKKITLVDDALIKLGSAGENVDFIVVYGKDFTKLE